jgi:hypothetical protein
MATLYFYSLSKEKISAFKGSISEHKLVLVSANNLKKLT